MPVPDQVRDDGSGSQNVLKSLDSSRTRSGICRNDLNELKMTFYDFINIQLSFKQVRADVPLAGAGYNRYNGFTGGLRTAGNVKGGLDGCAG